MKKLKYICPYCATSFNSIELLKDHVVKEHRTHPLPSSEGMIGLTVNGQNYMMYVEPEWTLHYLLHDRMGFTGAKTFCDRGACSSCTIIMDGRPILSCMALAIECDGKDIETVEGIAGQEHPLIESYIENNCMQCGYCTPGFIVTAKALLDKNPNPTKSDVKEALAGNLCRCGTYPQHLIAVLEAAKKLQE